MVPDYDFYYKLLNNKYLHYLVKQEDIIDLLQPIKKTEMGKCILLIRVSTGKQDLDQQTESVKLEAKKAGYDESDMYIIEAKESGSKLNEEDRVGLKEMKQIIDSDNNVDCVFTYEISRISRKTEIVYSIRDFLISHKVNLICCNPYFRLLKEDGTLSETASIVFSIFAGLSEQETYLRVQRIMRGKERKKSEGKLSVGSPIYGYSVNKDHYPVIHPIEGEIVREIFDRYVNARESSGSIAKDLYLRKCFRRQETKLLNVQNHICTILREKRYAGLVADSIYPQLVSKEIYEQAAAIREKEGGKFTRKSRTKEVYPLQGYLYTVDGYLLTIGITNGRYIKMNDATTAKIGVNMKASHELTKSILIKYLSTGIVETNIEAERLEANKTISINKIKVSSIDEKIEILKKENDFINARIVKGRLSEDKGDAMIDENLKEMKSLEDERFNLLYISSKLENRLIYLANPLLLPYDSNPDIKNNEDLRKYVEKYIKKIVVNKLGFSRYRFEYTFLDGSRMSGCYYNVNKKLEIYDLTFL